MNRWPHDDNESLVAFYGDPNSCIFSLNLISFTPSFPLRYKGDNDKVSTVSRFVVHKKCLDAFGRIFVNIWHHYSKDLDKVRAENMDWFGGCYNNRTVRGSSTKFSTHAFAAAIDIDPEHNLMNRIHQSNIPQAVIDIYKAEGAFWGGDFKSRQDPMHFQFATED